jgi:SWI/SNF-related matrix-associated actin-dependent regulator 1 of chromatin subfamily A
MSSYFGNNNALVPDSPAVKRQKTASGYTSTSNSANNTNAYNSDVDSGDDLFAGYVPDTPVAGKFETQPTQIIDRSAPAPTPLLSSPMPANKHIQVPASSPFNANTGRREDRLRSPTPVKTASPLRNLASAMAPAGTAYKAPVGISKKPAVAKKKIINLDSDDEGPSYVGDSSDEDTLSSANIKPSTFAPKLSQNTSRSFGSQEQPKVVNGHAKFHSIVANAAYNPSEKGPHPMAWKYSHPQRDSSRALPIQDLDITDISDEKLRKNVIRLRNILPKVSILKAKDALITTQGDIDAAATLLVEDEEPDDDVVEIPAPQKMEPHMRRGLAAPIKSIKDRYSSTQAQPTQRAHNPPVVTPQKPKRKLMKGRKEPTSPTVASPSPVKLPSSPARANDSYDSDSGMEEPEESEDNPVLEERLLKYLNKCKLDELIELTNTTKANAEAMLAARPFRTLDAARNVSTAKTLKNGKKSSKAPMGDRLVDTALSMFSGYEAVDALVAKCEELSKPLEAEMAKWGFNTFGGRKEGDGLELVSFEDDAESQRDSGIGSPSSTPSVSGEGVDDDKIVSAKRRKPAVKFLKKPELMAESVVLKDYQIVGLNWLNLMYNHNLSCILADDMGLGKTCQVISFLSHLVATGHPGPHVVFGPAAVFENWCQEFIKFAPNLAIQPYHGKLGALTSKITSH